LYYVAENLNIRKNEFADRIVEMTQVTKKDALEEVDTALQRIFTFAAYADKYDGRVHHTTKNNVTMAMPEPVGTIAIICPEDYPLLGFVTTVMAAITMGNNVVVVPSEKHPFSATDFYQILDTSDVPAGTVNIVTGNKDELTEVLAKHDGIDGIWYFGSDEGSKKVEFYSADNLKRTWVNHGQYWDWNHLHASSIDTLLGRAIEIKNIWIPYGA
jgi:aldehyde dehydrogenase (NAD+)